MKKLILISLFALSVFAGCKKDELPDGGSRAGFGRIELSLSGEGQLCVEQGTKGTPSVVPSIDEVDFTITGLADDGTAVCEKILFQQNGDTDFAWFRAGTYTVTAVYAPDGAEQGNGALCYRGESQSFILEPSGTAYPADGSDGPLTILMTPSNARVKVLFDPSLKEFYKNVSVGFTSPREISVDYSNADADGVCTLYLEAGRLGAYGITAVPLEDSGAHDVEITGLYLPVIIPDSGPELLEAGKEYTLKVKFAPGGIAVFLDGDSAPAYTTEETWTGLFS